MYKVERGRYGVPGTHTPTFNFQTKFYTVGFIRGDLKPSNEKQSLKVCQLM